MIKRVGAALAAGTMAAVAWMTASQAGTSTATFTTAQAAAGAKTYRAQCSSCHGANLEGVSAPALRGSGSGLSGDSVSQAYNFISTQMPMGNAGGLSKTEYANLMAFLLSRNGHAAGSALLTPAGAQKSASKV